MGTTCEELSNIREDDGYKGHYTLQWKSTYIDASGMFLYVKKLRKECNLMKNTPSHIKKGKGRL